MSPEMTTDKIGKFQDMVGSTERMGVSEFARSKSWRDRLCVVGCFEVVDRGGLVGYMLAPDYATAMSERISELEAQVEQMQIAAMFKAREGYTDIKTGAQLETGALEYFDKNIDRLMEALDGD